MSCFTDFARSRLNGCIAKPWRMRSSAGGIVRNRQVFCSHDSHDRHVVTTVTTVTVSHGILSNSLILVLARVLASTCLTMTAQYRLYFPSPDGRLPETTTEPGGI